MGGENNACKLCKPMNRFSAQNISSVLSITITEFLRGDQLRGLALDFTTRE
jgi:hypothetical protein